MGRGTHVRMGVCQDDRLCVLFSRYLPSISTVSLDLLPLTMINSAYRALIALLFAAPALSWPDTDQYGGKKLAGITNYTVITDIFIQDSPTFNSTGYNLLNDSFGLIDKSPERWTNLTKWVARRVNLCS